MYKHRLKKLAFQNGQYRTIIEHTNANFGSDIKDCNGREIFEADNVRYAEQVKSPKMPALEGYYDFLNIFEHEDVEVVKKVMRFLVYLQNSTKESLVVDVNLPQLNRFGFKRMKDS